MHTGCSSGLQPVFIITVHFGNGSRSPERVEVRSYKHSGYDSLSFGEGRGEVKNYYYMNILYLVLSILAVWRITHLFSKEDGPFDIIFWLRKKAGNGFWGSLLDCFYCTSVWVSLPFAAWMGRSWLEKLLCWAALSGAACLLEQATTNRVTKPQQDMPDYKED